MSENDSSTPTTTSQAALAKVVTDIERGTARLGWDRPATLYALVKTGELVQTPGLPEDVRQQISQSWDGSPDHLSAVLQESIGEESLEEMLPKLAWPESVAGAAVSVERIIVPPEVENEAPEDPEEALDFISSHPARTDVRLTIGVLRAGESWCEVRSRVFDSDEQVGSGERLIPALVDALHLGFEVGS